MTEDDANTLPVPPRLPVPEPGPGFEDGLQPGIGGAQLPTAARHRRSWLTGPVIGAAIVVVIVVAAVVANFIDLNYYALQPGTAQSVQQFITVPTSKGHPVTHPVLLTDVELGRVTALNYLFYRLQSDTTLDPLESVTGGTPPSELNAQGVLEMSQAESYAKTAALRRLGYQVTAHPSGAVVFATYPGTPAWGVLQVGDVITAVDGMPTLTTQEFQSVLAGYHSGRTVTLSVKAGGVGKAKPVTVTLKSTVVETGGVDKAGHPYTATVDLGVQAEDQVDYTYPFPVSIDVANIGGPSAGLAMTLGVIDELTGGSLTGGKTVAATGTMDDQGDVGDVGGVAQKTVAVENAGASIFLVPPQEYQAAKSKDRPGLTIYPVSTLDQALAVLAAHGGTVPPVSPTPATTTTSPGGGG